MPKKQKTFVVEAVVKVTMRLKITAKDKAQAESKAIEIAESRDALRSAEVYSYTSGVSKIEAEQAPDEKELRKIDPRKKKP